MHLLRLVGTHPTVVGMIDTAARTDEWAKFRMSMLDLDVDSKVLHDPFAVMMTMRTDAGLKFPAMMIVMHVGDSGIPWSANMSALSDFKRVGMHSITWGFSRSAHRKMREAGFNVAANS